MNRFSQNQQRAIEARGNVLVEAGAGAGKTRTLVERCVAWLLQGSTNSIDGILMVTFTDAAAAEMRHRIRAELTRAVDEHPDNRHLAEQIALLDTAAISTLHGFCFQLVRQHFYELDLDPQLAVMAQEEAQLLAEDTLSALLQRHYSGMTANAEAVQQLIEVQGRGWDWPIRRLVFRLHHYSQTLPDPTRWLRLQLTMFEQAEPTQWRAWLGEALVDWRALWLPVLQSEPEENTNAKVCADLLSELADPKLEHCQADILSRILEADQAWPTKKKTVLRKRLEAFFEEASFLHSLMDRPEEASSADEPTPCLSIDPLAEDWSWLRPDMIALLGLVEEFGSDFARAKRELGALDFHDIEQFSLRLLWDYSANRPTSLAEHWRKRLKLIFVDEYQDINAAQDAILSALGREGAEANRFLVGDVKQSIYRFRLAAPQIFQGYAREWRNDAARGTVIPLSDNFRSHEAILNFINPFFRSLMRKEIGGVDYDESAWLEFGNREARSALTVEGEKRRSEFKPHVELHLRLTGKGESEQVSENDRNTPDSEDGFLSEHSSADQEARLVGLRLRDLRMQRYQVWDGEQKQNRSIEWNDMVVLLRSPSGKVESFAKEFARLGVPLLATRGGFFDSPEVMDLLNLLALLDNPLQDVPALAVLRSPLAGLSLDELAVIRLAAKGRFWTALQQFHRQGQMEARGQRPEVGGQNSDTKQSPVEFIESSNRQSPIANRPFNDVAAAAWTKVDLFLGRFGDWRRRARETSLSQCLERILGETHYAAWLVAQSRGDQRRANVSKLLTWVRQFDQFHRQGLFRFLKFIDAQKNAEIDREPAPIETANAVRLMSIHQAKGLEFPIVVVADLGKAFNFSDLHESIILDEKYGICPLVKAPVSERRYPSLPYWLAQQRQRREGFGEEMRLLYVALTRACHTLILTGTTSRRNVEKRWSTEASARAALKIQEVLSARSDLDWLGPWLNEAIGSADWAQRAGGECDLLRWTIYDDSDPRLTPDDPVVDRSAQAGESSEAVDPVALEALQQRLAWQYPFLAATGEPAKASVSLLRRRINDEIMGETQKPAFASRGSVSATPRLTPDLSAAEVGTAHHIFCQFVSLDSVHSLAAIEAEADRMEQEDILSPAERKALKLPCVADFWKTDIGQKIIAQRSYLNRELPFTARISLGDLRELGGSPETAQRTQDFRSNLPTDGVRVRAALKDEFIVVQGVVDLAVLLPKEIWLLDFKTDLVTPNGWREKAKAYAPQLKLYSMALERIYCRPVANCWLHFLNIQRTVLCRDV